MLDFFIDLPLQIRDLALTTITNPCYGRHCENLRKVSNKNVVSLLVEMMRVFACLPMSFLCWSEVSVFSYYREL